MLVKTTACQSCLFETQYRRHDTYLQDIHGRWLAQSQHDVHCCFRQLQQFSIQTSITATRFCAELNENAYNNSTSEYKSLVIICNCACKKNFNLVHLSAICNKEEVGRYHLRWYRYFWLKISAISISFTTALFHLLMYFIITSKVVNDVNVISIGDISTIFSIYRPTSITNL